MLLKILGYIVQLLCLIGLFHGFSHHEVLRYIVCILGVVFLLYGIFNDFFRKKKNT